MRLQLKTGLASIPCLLLLLATPRAQADEVTGTWTGAIEGRANYFWERSTRVVVPSVDVSVSSPGGTRVGAGYLLDAITSASIAQTGSTDDEVETEYRHGVGGEVGHSFDLEDSQLDLDLNAKYSTENDYRSFAYGLSGGLWLDDKNTKLTLACNRVDDVIESNANPALDEDLFGVMVGVGVEQIIDPRLVLALGYQFGYLEGFLANAYRNVLIGPLPYPERHPEKRYRHEVSARLGWAVTSHTAVHLLYGAYADSWDVAALSPELRVYQLVGEDFLIRPRYRFYIQTKAWFRLPSYPQGWEGPITADPKLAALRTHTLGLALEHRLHWLQGSFLDFGKHAWIDLGFDRYFTTSSFGNGILATAGGRLEW
jgi:hypothetical protein